MNVQSAPQAGGICGTHGVYNGRVCPACSLTSKKATLRQAVWEASQHLNADEIRAYVEAVIREIESDEP